MQAGGISVGLTCDSRPPSNEESDEVNDGYVIIGALIHDSPPPSGEGSYEGCKKSAKKSC
jgi:hypothetical protein